MSYKLPKSVLPVKQYRKSRVGTSIDIQPPYLAKRPRKWEKGMKRVGTILHKTEQAWTRWCMRHNKVCKRITIVVDSLSCL